MANQSRISGISVFAMLSIFFSANSHSLDVTSYLSGTLDSMYSDNAVFDNDGASQTYRYSLVAGFRASLSDRISLAGQALIVGKNEYDKTSAHLDYLFINYSLSHRDSRFLDTSLGRVKIPYGLFNESRDIVFSRNSYDLPASIYFDSVSGRNVIFSADGARIDFYRPWGEFELQASAAYGVDRKLDDEDKEKYIGEFAENVDIKLTANAAAQIGLINIDRTLELKWSYLGLDVQSEFHSHGSSTSSPLPDSLLALLPLRPLDSSDNGNAMLANTHVNVNVLSFRYEPGQFHFISEVSRNHVTTGAEDDVSISGIAGYAQVGWRWSASTQWYFRHDRRHLLDDDRWGKAYSESSGSPAHRAYFIRESIGLEYAINQHIRLYADISYNEGTLNILSTAFDGEQQLDKHWLSGVIALAWRL